jgi:hypothetical protein
MKMTQMLLRRRHPKPPDEDADALRASKVECFIHCFFFFFPVFSISVTTAPR